MHRASPAALGVRSRLLLGFLARRPRQERWPLHRVVREAGISPVAGLAGFELLRELGLVRAHSCDDGFVRFTITPAGRRRLEGRSDT